MKIEYRDARGMAIFFFIALIGILFILSVQDVIDVGDHIAVIRMLFSEFAVLSMMIIGIIVFFNCSFTNRIHLRTASPLLLIFCIACMSLITSIACSIDADDDPMFFNCAPVLIFFVSIWCGPKVGIPVSLITSCILLFTHYNTYPASTIGMCAILVTFALCSGAVSAKKIPNKTKSMSSAVVATVISSIITLLCICYGDSKDPNYALYCALSLVAMIVMVVFFQFLMEMMHDVADSLGEYTKSKKDLSLAHDLQQSYLTKVFPSAHSMDFYAFMEPASSIGGDFYDIYRINHNLTFMVVADVSDKGLPASMLMMRAMGMIRSASSVSNDPGTILSILNKQLCDNNPTGQFITAFVCVYDSDTGLFAYSNAGHTPPYIRHPGGRFERLEVPKGLIIGASESAKYSSMVTELRHGDTVFCYTDGVSEAFDTNDNMFGQKRLVDTLDRSAAKTAKDLIGEVNDAVIRFRRGNEVSDDVTMLSFIVYRDWYRHRDFDASVSNLDGVKGFVRSVLEEAGCPEKKIMKMEIVAEEIFVNICDHAYEGWDGGDVTVYCSVHENEVKMTFTDKALTFNPVMKEDIVIDHDVNKWDIGGFGIHMVKELTDHMTYKRFCGLNIFTVWAIADESKGNADPDDE